MVSAIAAPLKQQPVVTMSRRSSTWRFTAPMAALAKMAAHYLDQIQSVQLSGPYYLLGYSFGGYVAFEAACQL